MLVPARSTVTPAAQFLQHACVAHALAAPPLRTSPTERPAIRVASTRRSSATNRRTMHRPRRDQLASQARRCSRSAVVRQHQVGAGRSGRQQIGTAKGHRAPRDRRHANRIPATARRRRSHAPPGRRPSLGTFQPVAVDPAGATARSRADSALHNLQYPRDWCIGVDTDDRRQRPPALSGLRGHACLVPSFGQYPRQRPKHPGIGDLREFGLGSLHQGRQIARTDAAHRAATRAP